MSTWLLRLDVRPSALGDKDCMKTRLVTTLFVALLTLGCDSTPSGGIGAPCNADNECADDNCSLAEVCTRSCTRHSDCGCAAGTTNGDILDGFCDVSCTDRLCRAVCDSSDECAGSSRCRVSTFGTCR